MTGRDRPERIAYLAASVALSYPDEATLALVPPLRLAARALPERLADPLARVLDYLAATPPTVAAAHYVETFDLRRRCCLYLTYYTHGDTRRRGLALLRFRRAYQAAGFEVTAEELPDHLAVVLEFAASGHGTTAVDLLVEHRAGLELLSAALERSRSPYAGAVAAVRASLPAPGAADLAAARRLAEEGPPTERVGLAPAPGATAAGPG